MPKAIGQPRLYTTTLFGCQLTSNACPILYKLSNRIKMVGSLGVEPSGFLIPNQADYRLPRSRKKTNGGPNVPSAAAVTTSSFMGCDLGTVSRGARVFIASRPSCFYPEIEDLLHFLVLLTSYPISDRAVKSYFYAVGCADGDPGGATEIPAAVDATVADWVTTCCNSA